MVNYQEFKIKSKEIQKKYNLNYYEVLQRFMFERILERISISKYQDNFILKGGLLLSTIFGIENRTTKDMDATIKGLDISKEKMAKVLNEILNINLNDDIKFDLVDITNIRADDEYGGNKYYITGKFQNLKVNLEIDISTGDKITPKELKYKYPLMFEERNILINSYNNESILSEKIETILRRGKYNSRMKDYYDIYMFLTKLKNDLNIEGLKKAIINTFEIRNSDNYLNDYIKILDDIKNSEKIHNLWNRYKIKNRFAENIELEEIILLVEEIITNLQIVKISI